MKVYFLLILSVLCFSGGINPKRDNSELYQYPLSNKEHNLEKRCVTAGDQLYAIGWQDGSFPSIGNHIKGEMGGIWSQPIKLLDDFSFDLDSKQNQTSLKNLKSDEYLSYPYASSFIYNVDTLGLQIIRTQFVPDGQRALIAGFTFINKRNTKCELNFKFHMVTDLRPAWLAEQVNLFNGEDSLWFEKDKDAIIGKDLAHNWYVVVSSDKRSDDTEIGKAEEGTGQASFNYRVIIPPHGEVRQTMFITGSDKSKNEALSTLDMVKNTKEELFLAKKQKFQKIEARSKIIIPDKKLELVYNWVKYNTEWLVVDVPEIGRGLAAGFPEFAWWFGCDNTYALQGVLATGDFELAKSTLRLLKDISKKTNKNGRVVHEITTNGAIFNPGNTQETAHFIMAVWKTFEWTGDTVFLSEFYPFVKQGIHWLTSDMDKNGNLFPEGYGISEVPGLSAELIDVAVYTQQALECAGRMAGYYKDEELSTSYLNLSTKLKDKINIMFWDEKEKTYYDFYSTAEQAVSVAEGVIKQYNESCPEIISYYSKLKSQFKNYPKNYSHGWSTGKYWVINTPLETGITPRQKAIAALDRLGSNYFCGQWGPYLSSVNKESTNMTIATGVQAVAECRYGRPDRALKYINAITNSFGYEMPGSINEIMPDYGCFVQEWTNYGIEIPLIQFFFGIHPEAYNKKVIIKPDLPIGWENIQLKNLRVGENIISFSRERDSGQITYHLVSKDPYWKFVLQISEKGGNIRVNDISVITAEKDGLRNLELTGTENTIIISD